ncbi:Pyrimidine deaminase domain of riboflavin biosynthesis-containing protein RibD [Paractinoplanes atraurantiacus]|uniref:Pyrimidine deaminase domain of riboflavin biosynthesis-containing protein RibD n=1 Tax=Paractinoplanes atraurantiacus TaxID=1036182 RepID=A0A285ILC1_9ACTN|nr:Pyrimidine deaminase domain of riboflavin biosynthesis-containing protein RibD [Actinoplanes atraurantiacus]
MVGARGVGGRDDAYWMRQALLCAMAAEGRASPNPTVGAVIVKDGVLIAAGATEPYGGRHAERCAIDSVADRAVLRGATIYTTLEPCAHWGKQPPCADLVASCGFARCVSGLRDPDPRVAGVGLERVRAAGTEVGFGPLRNELLAWHLPYLTQRLTGRPLITAMTAAAAALPYRDRLRRQCDVLITGLPTVAPLEPGPWRGVIWWDLNGRTTNLTSDESRDLSAQARALGVPVILVAPRTSSLPNVTHVVPPAGSAAGWLRSYSASAELAAVIGEQPNWLLVDDYPELAGVLAAGHGLDVVHAFDGSRPPAGDLIEITQDELIAEYCAPELLSVLAGTTW